MPQDAFTLYHQAKELNKMLAGGKINKIAQPTESEVYFSVYANNARYKLAVSANVATARVCTAAAEKENPLAAYNFCMLLRKHLLNAVIKEISLDGFDRVIKLVFSCYDELFGEKEKILYAEIMGKYSNAVLVQDGKVLGAMKTASVEEASKRPLIVNFPYLPPPSQDKLSPLDPALAGRLAQFIGGDLGKFLFENVAGLSFQTAAEIAYRFGESGALNLAAAEKLYRFIGKFLFETKLEPCVKVGGNGAEDFFAFRYETLSGEYRLFPSLNAAEEFFFEEKDKTRTFSALKNKLSECVKKEEKKFLKRLSVISDKENDCRDAQTDKIKGDLILSNIYRVKKGDKVLVCENFYADNAEIKIFLDENLSAQDNAQRYYKKYNKQKRTLRAIAPQKEEVLAALAYIESLKSEIELAENAQALSFVEAELVAAGYLKKKAERKPGKKPAAAGYIYEIDGFTVRAGRNNSENDFITSSARGKDIWLHAKKYHSSHVVIDVRERPVTQKVVKAAAEICAYYSAGRGGTKIDIDYAEKKFVKKPPKAAPGFWIYSEFSTVTVDPAKHEEFLKQR